MLECTIAPTRSARLANRTHDPAASQFDDDIMRRLLIFDAALGQDSLPKSLVQIQMTKRTSSTITIGSPNGDDYEVRARYNLKYTIRSK